MRTLDGRTFLTLNEYLAVPGRSLPYDLSHWTVYTPEGNKTMAAYVLSRYARRYIFTADTQEFNEAFNEVATRVRYQFEGLINNTRKLESDFIADGFESRSERKRPYSGAVNIENAPTEDAVVVHSSGASSGNIDKIIRYQTEFRNMIKMCLDQFSGLFISVVSDWGKEIG